MAEGQGNNSETRLKSLKRKKESEDDDEGRRVSPTLSLRPIDNTDWSQFNIIMPDNVVQFRDVVPLPDNKRAIGDTINCCLGEIHDLSKFWMFDLQKFSTFDEELEAFYRENRSNYKMAPILIREELYCVIDFYGSFRRCTILEVSRNPPDRVKVFLIDLGFIFPIHIKHCYYLSKQFAQLPAQAIRARLANILPLRRNGSWDDQAIDRFETLRREITDAIVVSVGEDLAVDVLLQNEFTDLCVNDVLVDEGYAVRRSQDQLEPQLNVPNGIPSRENMHLYPSFEELENGDHDTRQPQ